MIFGKLFGHVTNKRDFDIFQTPLTKVKKSIKGLSLRPDSFNHIWE